MTTERGGRHMHHLKIWWSSRFQRSRLIHTGHEALDTGRLLTYRLPHPRALHQHTIRNW